VIRFRHTEDEARYLRLRSAIYREIATHLPARLVSTVMRNLGKMEQVLHLEGIRQGVSVAELSLLAQELGGRDLRAFQAHATLYGSQDTPLTDVEQEWLEKLGLDPTTADGAWLDRSPMRFAPKTVVESGANPRDRDGVKLAPGVTSISAEELLERRGTEPTELQLLDRQAPTPGGRPPDVDGYKEVEPGDYADEEIQPESPSFLDRVRGQIQTMTAGGWKAESYQQLVLDLHRELQTDAAFLDLQLSTHVGRTMLTQCGIFLNPGHGINLGEMGVKTVALKPPWLAGSPPKTAVDEETDPNSTKPSEDGGTDPSGRRGTGPL
jgi:hypothetical protein